MKRNIAQKIIQLIKRRQWDQIMISLQQQQHQHRTSQRAQEQQQSKQLQHQPQPQSHITSFIAHSKLLSQLSHCHSTLLSHLSSPSTSQQLAIFEQFIIKLYSKSLIIVPQLNQVQDLEFINKVLAQSINHKYLFIIWQEGVYELRDKLRLLRAKENLDYFESFDAEALFNIELKYMSLCSGFVGLVGNVVFKDLVDKFMEMHHFCNNILNQQSQANMIPLVNSQHQPNNPKNPLKPFLTHFYATTLTNLSTTLSHNPKLYQTLSSKPHSLQQLFQFLTHLYNCIHQASSQSQKSLKTQLLSIVSFVVDQLQIPYAKRYKELPEFWVIHKFEEIKDYSSHEKMTQIALHVTIKHVPSKLQFIKLPNEILLMIKFVCQSLCQKNTPITSFRANSSYSSQFSMIDIIQRLSILPGILNPQDPYQSYIISLINTFINRKQLFSSYALGQVLWRQIIQRHTDTNFIIFCLGQYKKSLSIPIKLLKGQALTIIANSSKFVLQQVKQLQPNNSPELIGYYLTVVIYLFALVEKVRKSYNFGEKKEEVDNIEIGTNSVHEQSVPKGEKLVINYFLSQQRISLMKQSFLQILFKLKQGLKDRLQVAKIKTNNDNSYQNSQSDRNAKENNQISLCIYRIEKQINFS